MNLPFLGDSTIAGVDGAVEADGTLHYTTPLTSYLSVPGYSVLNYGVPGQTLAQLLCTLPGILAGLEAGSIVVVEGGINDCNLSNTTFASELESAVDLIEVAGFTAILQTPTRCNDGRADDVAGKAQTIRDTAKSLGVGLIDMHAGVTIVMPEFAYGAHPDEAGYEVMGLYADKRIKQILDPNFPAWQRRTAAVSIFLGG